MKHKLIEINSDNLTGDCSQLECLIRIITNQYKADIDFYIPTSASFGVTSSSTALIAVINKTNNDTTRYPGHE